MRLRRILPVAGLLGALASPASAQQAPVPAGAGLVWLLRGVEFSACVDFLVDPAIAAKQLDSGYRIVSAGAFTPLSPALRREITSDSAYAGWVPSRLCVHESQSISVGDRLFTPTDSGGRESVGYWGIAATRTDGAPRQDQWFAVKLWTGDWHIQKPTELAYVPLSVFKRSLAPVPETTRWRYQVKIGKTTLSWDGELVGRDSTAAPADAPAALQANLIFDGQRHIRWWGTLTADPRWMRYLPGLFRVEGKDDLAKALKASPIRMFGPMYWGGEVRVAFSRTAP